MFERFAPATKEKVRRASEIAEYERSATVEADHLLLALVEPADDTVGDILIRSDVTAGAIRDARDREFRSALALVGVETTHAAPSGARRLRRGRTTRFGQSSKLALERAVEHATRHGDRRVTTRHLAQAIISAETGSTPRLLRQLGTTADELGTAFRTRV